MSGWERLSWSKTLPKSDKLVRLTVDFGTYRRKILSGMKNERKDVKEILGKQALFVVNLEPRKMMGEISEGIIFDVGFADGISNCTCNPRKRST